MNPKLSAFLATGQIPITSKERNLLLDLARLELSQKTKTTTMNYKLADGTPINTAEIAKLNAEAAAERAARAAAKTAKEQLNAAKSARATVAAELSRLTGKPAPAAPVRRATTPVAAAPPKAKTVFDIYKAMPSGCAKIAYLAKNAVEIQTLAKQS